MAKQSDSRGRLVPLSVPLHTPQLALLRSLRAQADQLQERIQKLVKLEEQLKEIPDEPRWDALIPVPPSSSLAYARGNVTNTNTVMVHFDASSTTGEDTSVLSGAGDTTQQGYWVEYSAKQARGVADRRKANLKAKKDKIHAAIAQAEGALSSEMGFAGGSINQNFELLNEEGLPFVEIQEFEEDDAQPIASTSNAVLPSEKPPQPSISSDPSPATKASVSKAKETSHPTSAPSKARKSVSFATKDEYEPSPSSRGAKEEEDIPVIASEKAAASAGLPSSKLSKVTEVEASAAATPASMTSSFADLTIKPSIVVKETTKPPPVLTAAERSARSRSKYDVAAEFDGVEPKKVDLSAYLPRQLRGTPIAATFKGKARAFQPGTDLPAQQAGETSQAGSVATGEEGYDEYDDQLDDSDDDGYYDDDDIDSDEDNTHIDDILAMREAAMEYHAKRHALGAGLGTGPLGGFGREDEFDEPGLTEYDKGGLPIVESYEDDGDGERRPSRFRKSRLQTAQMVIPELKPGDVDVTETILPGDSLGPFEDEETVDAGAHGTNDFKGMSKEEIETFLRYVKALETGEQLEDLTILPAGSADAKSAPLPMDQVVPPSVKETVKKLEGPSIKDSVVEKNMKPEVIAKPVEPPSEKPKRVSRFRAARGGDS